LHAVLPGLFNVVLTDGYAAANGPALLLLESRCLAARGSLLQLCLRGARSENSGGGDDQR
jgi:hypothetical protein